MTAAFLLALGAALAGALLARRPAGWRELIPLAVAAGALIQTLGAGAAGWVAPALLCLVGVWVWRERGARAARAVAASGGWLVAITAVCVLPVWVVLSDFLSNKGHLLDELFSSGQSTHTKLGNLIHPLSAWQLAGIWPVGDFRVTAPTLESALWIGLALLAAAGALFLSVRRRQFGLAFYVAVALIGSGVVYFSGGTPWVTGKSLALSSPAVLVGGARGRGHVVGSAAGRRTARTCAAHRRRARDRGAGRRRAVVERARLSRSDARATRARWPSCSTSATLVAGKGPTFINEYEVYADRHFLREGAPVEPAEYRTATLPLRNGAILTKGGSADLDSFPLSTLLPYRSIVVRRSPVQSRPPSIYRLVWQGRYYELFQRPAEPTATILEHVPYGDSNKLAYLRHLAEPVRPRHCARSNRSSRAPRARRSRASPARRSKSTPSSWPTRARRRSSRAPTRACGPVRWFHNLEEHTLTPTTPGTAVSHIAVASEQSYELWLGGSFGRGIEVSVDGHHLGRAKDETVEHQRIRPRRQRRLDSRRPHVRAHLPPRGSHAWQRREGIHLPHGDRASAEQSGERTHSRRPGAGDAAVRTSARLARARHQPSERRHPAKMPGMLQRVLALPETADLDVDGANRLVVHAAVLRRKPMLAAVFRECHELMLRLGPRRVRRRPRPARLARCRGRPDLGNVSRGPCDRRRPGSGARPRDRRAGHGPARRLGARAVRPELLSPPPRPARGS